MSQAASGVPRTEGDHYANIFWSDNAESSVLARSTRQWSAKWIKKGNGNQETTTRSSKFEPGRVQCFPVVPASWGTETKFPPASSLRALLLAWSQNSAYLLNMVNLKFLFFFSFSVTLPANAVRCRASLTRLTWAPHACMRRIPLVHPSGCQQHELLTPRPNGRGSSSSFSIFGSSWLPSRAGPW